MSKLQNDNEPMLTGQQLEMILGAALATVIGFWITKLLILPEISFCKFFLIELIIMALYGLGNLLLKKK